MKILKSEVENPVKMENLVKNKVLLTDNGENHEHIWVGEDATSGKMYLLNMAVALYPFSSYGMEFDIASEIDVAEAKGSSPEEAKLVLHPEIYQIYVDNNWINESGELDFDAYFERINEGDVETKAEVIEEVTK